MIAWTIEAAKNAKSLDFCLVSTNDREIRDIARKYGGRVPFKRPKELAEDVDSIPSYSPLIIREENHRFINVLTFEELWESLKCPIITDGFREMKHIKDHHLAVFTGNCSANSKLFTEITAISRHYFSGELVRVNTTDGLVDVTPNHSLIDAKGNVVNSSNIKIKDRMAQPPLKIGSIPECDTFIGGKDLAWLMGFFVAEGSLAKSPGQCMINFANKDLAKLEKVRRIFQEYFHTAMNISINPICSRAGATSQKAFLFFRQCYQRPYISSYGSKCVPKVILNSRKAIKLAFLDGYNDGDGATKPQKKWHSGRYKRFGSISQVLCLGLLLLISQTTGQKASVHCRDDKPHFTQLIFNSGENKRYKIPNAVKKTRPINYAGWVYDAETCFHQFCTGVGSLRAHNTTLVAIDALERYEAKKHKRVGHVCILQPTSPFRTSDDIDRCVQIAVTTGVDTVISVTKAHQSPYWMLQMKPFSHELESFMNIDFEGDNLVSQNLPTLFYPNGAVYVVRRDVLMSGRIFGEKIYAYMMPRERSIDLEEEYDFAVASALMPQFLSKEPYQKISWVIP